MGSEGISGAQDSSPVHKILDLSQQKTFFPAISEASRAMGAPQEGTLLTRSHALIGFCLPGQDWLRNQVSLVRWWRVAVAPTGKDPRTENKGRAGGGKRYFLLTQKVNKYLMLTFYGLSSTDTTVNTPR